MYKNSTYKEKFAILKNWMPSIIESVKKDLKSEHLKKDWSFTKRHFGSKNANKLTIEELSEAYLKEITTGEQGEELGEFVSNRWLLKNSEVYHFFEDALTKINPNFNEIETLDPQQSTMLMKASVAEFDAPRTFLFCVMNSVVLSNDVYEELDRLAQKERSEKVIADEKEKEKLSLDELKKSYEQQLSRLEDKYRKRILGLESKYIQDTESLKKQISCLQRKLNTQASAS